MADQQFLLDEVTDVPYDAALAPTYVSLPEVARRFEREFPDVAQDADRMAIVRAGVDAALDLGLPMGEAMPMVARLARKADVALSSDSPAARSAAIAEIARARGQGGLQ